MGIVGLVWIIVATLKNRHHKKIFKNNIYYAFVNNPSIQILAFQKFKSTEFSNHAIAQSNSARGSRSAQGLQKILATNCRVTREIARTSSFGDRAHSAQLTFPQFSYPPKLHIRSPSFLPRRRKTEEMLRRIWRLVKSPVKFLKGDLLGAAASSNSGGN